MRRRLVGSSLALLTVNLALAVGYCRVFAGWSWLFPLVVIAAVTQAIATWGNLRALPFAVVGPLSVLVGAWVTTVIQLRETLWYGLPGPRTIEAFGTAISDSWQQVGEVVPPLPFQSGFGIAAMLSLVFVAVVSDSFVHRAAGRLESLIPSALVFIVVSAVGVDRSRVAVTALWIATATHCVIVLRRLDSRVPSRRVQTKGFGSRSVVIGVGTAITSAMLAAVATPFIPGAYDEPWLERRGEGEQRIVDPMVDVRGRLFSGSDTVLFRVSAEVATYWRLTSLPTFDGTTWGISQGELNGAGGELAPIREPLAGDTLLTSYQTFEIEGLAGNLLPASFEPVQLRAATRSLFYALEPGALVVGGTGLKSTDSYELVSKIPNPSYLNLMSAGVSRPPSTEYLAVPDTPEMERLRRLALDVTEGAASPYLQALALQNWFRTEFEYSLDVPAGDGTDATMQFIDRRTGYCEQFSSTMALLSRLLGIPSRVAIGFTPGDLDSDGSFTVRSQHAHAWPELWFDDIGWVLFEPTPGRGAPNASYTGVDPQQDESTPSTTTTVVPTSSTPATTTATTQTSNAPTTVSATDRRGRGSTTPIWIIIATVLVSWLTLMPALVRRLSADESRPLISRWRRVLEVYSESGWNIPQGLTPLEIAALLPPKAGLDEQLVTDLAGWVTGHIYAGHTDGDDILVRRSDDWLRDARRRLTGWQRIRLRIDPVYVSRMHR